MPTFHTCCDSKPLWPSKNIIAQAQGMYIRWYVALDIHSKMMVVALEGRTCTGHTFFSGMPAGG